MKILIFTTVFSPSVGGIETLTETLAEEFSRQGHTVVVATRTHGPETGDGRFQVVRRPGVLRLIALIRWCDVLMHANVSLKEIWQLFLSPRKSVLQHHGAYKRDDGSAKIRDRLKRFVARRWRGIAVSSYVRTEIGAGSVIPNCYDAGLFRATAPWDERPGDIVFLGRLVPQKGADLLLEALRLMKEGAQTRYVTIIGDGPERAKLEAFANMNGLREHVRFTGALQGNTLLDSLNAHKLIAIPSRYEEPFGIAALEGLACGCVPVVADHGGLPEAIGNTGVRFKAGDARALAQALSAALSPPDEPRVAAHLSRHTQKVVADRYLQCFAALSIKTSS